MMGARGGAGIGRQGRLKLCCPKGRVGSSPTRRTRPIRRSARVSRLALRPCPMCGCRFPQPDVPVPAWRVPGRRVADKGTPKCLAPADQSGCQISRHHRSHQGCDTRRGRPRGRIKAPTGLHRDLHQLEALDLPVSAAWSGRQARASDSARALAACTRIGAPGSISGRTDPFGRVSLHQSGEGPRLPALLLLESVR